MAIGIHFRIVRPMMWPEEPPVSYDDSVSKEEIARFRPRAKLSKSENWPEDENNNTKDEENEKWQF